MSHGILVPLDGSPSAARVLPYAELLAERCHAELTLVQAIVPAPRGRETTAQALQRAEAEDRERLAALQTELTARGLAVAVTTLEGAPAEVISTVAREQQAALIVMATHGRTGPSRWVMGSVAEHVLRKAHLPILLLAPTALESGGPERLLQRIAVPVDGSPLSERILPVVTELARRLGDPVTLVRAVDPWGAPGLMTQSAYGVYMAPPQTEELLSAARPQVAALAEGLRAGGVAAEEVVVEGPPVEVITGYVTDRGAGWIAMASHGRGEWGGLVLGSTALAVLRQTNLPVLIAATSELSDFRLGEAHS